MMSITRWKEMLSHWELMPFKLIYAPIAPLWLWCALKSKAVWWFTPANPTLKFAGFDGEGKKEMYDQLPPELYPITVYVKVGEPFEQVVAKMQSAGLTFPVCVKPEVGLKGLLFRKVDNAEKLQQYHRHMPIEFLIQSLEEAPLEVSVFYYRLPNQKRGVISGFIQKDMMHVFGDGKQTVWELIQKHPKAVHRLEEMRIKHESALESVLPAGEKYILSHAANLNRGAIFTNLKNQIDDKLLQIFDPLSHRCQWYYGRYDLKCNSVEELKQGKFVILEFNGAGAEPNHVYNAGYSWPAALKEISRHWKTLYKISRYNHLQGGIQYWTNKEGKEWMAKAKAHGKLLEKLDREILI